MKKKFILAGIFLALFLLLIVAVKTVDVSDIGPMGTSIGLSHINEGVHKALGVSGLWYNVTEVLGVLALAVAALFALIGLIQLIKRKSILRIDAEILSVGCLYIAMAAAYVLFEVIVVNYRCIIMPGATEPEASFPSSHTMLVCVVLTSAVILASKYIKCHGIRLPLQIIGCLAVLVTVVGRLLSGVHWLTDIIGGVLISAALVTAFTALTELFKSKLLTNETNKEMENS